MPAWMDDDLADRKRRGLYRIRRRVSREYLNFASNDYLNLATHPALARAAARTAQREGTGATSSPLIVGWSDAVRRLEHTLAEWEGTESALTFSSGYAANLALISALAGRGDVVFSDELNHASLIDGCRLSRATTHVYRHADANHLADLMRQHAPQARRRLIVTDSVFSMDGDLAPLLALIELAGRFDAMLLVDEAHATGVVGATGRGLTELAPGNSLGDSLLKVGTLSKALGAQGGFVCVSKRVRRWLVNHARPYIFSTGLAPPIATAARVAVHLARDAHAARAHLLTLSAHLQTRLREAGYDVPAVPTQIVPIVIGDESRTLALSAKLREAGILVPAIRPPTVPAGTSRLRVSLTAGHTVTDVDRLVQELAC